MELTNRSVVKKPSRDRRVSKKRMPGYLSLTRRMPHTKTVDVSITSSPGLFTIEEVRNTNQKLIRDRNFLATNTGSRSKLIEEITLKLNRKINRESINDAYFNALKTLKNEI